MMWILLKKGLRSDRIWTVPFVFKSFLKVVPLFLDTVVLMRSQYWSRERMAKLQDARMRELFRYAVRIPFWENAFRGAGVEHTMSPREILARLPIVSKRDFTGKPLEEIAEMTLLPRADADHTSGSTGRPFHFFFDWHAGLRSFAVTERIFRTTTGGKRYPVVYMRARERNGFTFWRHEWFFLKGHHGVQYRMDDFAKLGEKFPNGFVLYGYTSSVVEVVRRMEERGMTLPLRAVMAAGENLSYSDRQYIERVTNAPLFTLYASREAGFLGYECEHHRLHVSEEWACIEIVDESGESVPPGTEGRVLVTTFDNRVMPFIRYELGDRAMVSDAPCPCGRTLPTITLRGRTAELIELEDGRRVSLLDISATVDWYWNTVRQFQIVQRSPLAFHLRVVPGPRYEMGKDELEVELVRLLHPRVQISWEIVEAIPEATSGKALYFVREF